MPLSLFTPGEEWSKLAPTLAKSRGKRKAAHVVSSSDEEGHTQVAEKQKKVPKRCKTRK